MKSNRSTLAAGALRFVQLLAFCIPTMMLLNAASANEPPTAGAGKIPGAKGTIEYKPEGWKGAGVTTYWKDSDGDDLGHPDTFDCNAWCIGARKAKAGQCVKVAGPSPCAESAKCECSR